MKLTSSLTAELVGLVSQRARRARVTLTGTSMEPLLRAGMAVDVTPLIEPPRIGDVLVFKSQNGLVAHRLVSGESLVFRAYSGIVARRLFDDATSTFVTCGDAYPDRAELVPSHLVVGRVTAVWTSAEPDAQRVDDARYYRLGRFFARTRPLRSFLGKARTYAFVMFAEPARVGPPAAFAALVSATHLFERGCYAEGVEVIGSVPRCNAIDMARRHHMSGFVARWFDQAAEAGVAIPDDLREPLRRLRWTNALQAGRVLACARDVRDTFASAAIPHIFLKGAARLAADLPGADLQFSGDVDVIVPEEMVDRALAALRTAGYQDIRAEHLRDEYAASHHREPLRSPHVDLPVEVHVTLARPAVVSQRLDYAALAPSSRCVNGPIGEVRILDEVASAVHLAYHARDLRVWRDIVLLSRMLRNFDDCRRERFNGFIEAERRDSLRLMSAVAAADAIAFGKPLSKGAVKRYVAWAEVREDLPRRFAHVDVMEAAVGRCTIPKLQLRHARRDFIEWSRIWIRNLVMLPFIARSAHRSRLRRRPMNQ